MSLKTLESVNVRGYATADGIGYKSSLKNHYETRLGPHVEVCGILRLLEAEEKQ